MPRARERSMIKLRAAGYLVGCTEHFNPFVKRRQDLFGFIDCIAIKPGKPILAVQVVNTNLRRHVVSIAANAAAKFWIQAGGRIVIHSWVERGKPKKWQLDLVRMELVNGEVIAMPA